MSMTLKWKPVKPIPLGRSVDSNMLRDILRAEYEGNKFMLRQEDTPFLKGVLATCLYRKETAREAKTVAQMLKNIDTYGEIEIWEEW